MTTDSEIKSNDERVAAGIADALQEVSACLVTGGMLFGPDRVAGRTQWGYGDERVVGLAVVAEIAAALAVDSVTLLRRDRRYGAATLMRQVIECEYLMWLFVHNDEEARHWLNADQRELRTIFAPHRIRELSGGRFDPDEYHEHCLLGGHPSPQARALLPMHALAAPGDVLWKDLTLHLSRTWRTLLEATSVLHCAEYVPDGLADSVAALLASSSS
jgi:hypothetical protein